MLRVLKVALFSTVLTLKFAIIEISRKWDCPSFLLLKVTKVGVTPQVGQLECVLYAYCPFQTMHHFAKSPGSLFPTPPPKKKSNMGKIFQPYLIHFNALVEKKQGCT